MDKCAEIQEKISQLAFETFKEHEGYEWFSKPLIPRISSQYMENRFVILGQETNTWYGNLKDINNIQLYGDLTKFFVENCYDDFCRHNAETYKGAFWTFTRALYKNGILNGSIVNHENGFLSHCWMDLFCIEKCKVRNDRTGRPSQNPEIANDVMKLQKDLVFKIFSIITPRVILATIGHANDYYLKKYALRVKDDEVDILPIDSQDVFGLNELAEFKIKNPEHPLYRTTIVRTYHPTFFVRLINRENILKEAKHKLEEKNIRMRKSDYYQNLIFERLKNA